MTPGPLLPSAPPLWLRFLSRFLPARHREVFLGDLIEEYEARRLRPGRPGPARRWLVAQALRSAVDGLAHRSYDAVRRIRRALGSGGGPRPRRNQMDILAQDLKYAVRRLFGSPGFTVVAVLSLGLGIGANAALFTVVNTLMLEGSGLQDPSTLVEVYTSDGGGYPYATSSFPDYFDLVERNEVFEDVVAHSMFFVQTEVDGGEPMLTMGEVVSGNYFDVFGVRPVIGRGFLPEEDETPDTHPVVVIGHDYWQRVFGADPAVVGRTVRILRRPYTVVGVAPDGFGGMWPGIMADIWVPNMMSDHVHRAFGGSSRLERRGNRSLFMTARLKQGVTPEQAAEHVTALSSALAEIHPETNEGRIMTVMPTEDVALHPFVDRALVPIAALLFAVVGLVLLIACTNLASFLLARGADRRKEIAVRLALGARRRALVRQLLTETVVLALLGGLGGLVLAQWTLALVMGFQPPIPLPINLDLRVDGRVLAFTMTVAVAAGMLFGMVPALRSTRPDVAPTLRDESGAVAGSRSRWTLRNTLVVAQVALSFVLLIGAGLFVRSLQKAQAIDPGFDTGPAAMIWPNLEMSLIPREEGELLWDQLAQRARSVPGVDRVALVDRLPLGITVQTTDLLPDGVEPPEGRDAYGVDYTVVDENYFEIMAVPILRGRGIEVTDTDASDDVVVVSEAFARRFWPGETAIGRTVDRSGREYRVVGVARDTKVRTLGEAPRPYAYFPLRQNYTPVLYLMVRGSLPAPRLLGQLQSTVREARPDLVMMDAITMRDHLAIPLYAPRMAAILLGVFGGVALLLSGIGLYGVVSYAVARRTREVGIRISLGADARQVVAMVVAGGMRLVVVGGVVGLILSAAVTWLLSRFLYGVSTLDIATFVAIPLILTGVAAIAAFVPARRASLVNPVEALRTE
jgi:predicted permease